MTLRRRLLRTLIGCLFGGALAACGGTSGTGDGDMGPDGRPPRDGDVGADARADAAGDLPGDRTGDGTGDADVPVQDECALGLDDCAEGATCVDEKRGYRCVCPEELVGDGRVCVAPPESTRISAGRFHTCRIRDGAVQCFGDNGYGQLGNGSILLSSTPVDVPLPAAAVEVAAGQMHSCAITEAGELHCWGLAPFTGTGTLAGRETTPVRVGTDSDWEHVVATTDPGAGYGCGLRAGGQLYCWGGNIGGDPAAGVVTVPTRIGDRSGWSAIAVSGEAICGLTDTGALHCWGQNRSGSVGDGTTEPRPDPVELMPGERFRSVAVASQLGCAVRIDGTLHCWGAQTVWDLDRTSTGMPVPPERVGEESDWVSVAAVMNAFCALRRDGTVWCAGGQYPRPRFDPLVMRPAGEPAVAVTIGGFVTGCLLGASGRAHCFGANQRGQLGLGVHGDRGLPHPTGTDGWTRLTGSLFQTCGIDDAGALACWGELPLGAKGREVAYQVPTRVGEATWRAAAIERNVLLGVQQDGSLWAQGSGPIGVAGVSAVVEPTRVGTATGWTHVASSDDHACGIRAGELYCWGMGTSGATGHADLPADVETPRRVGTDADWIDVVVAPDRTCGLRQGGALYCFGRGFTPAGSLVPVRADLVWDQVALSDDENACGVAAGELYCWGRNLHGRVDPTLEMTAEVTEPARIDDRGDWLAVSAGPFYACGVRGAGELHCWGASTERLEDPNLPVHLDGIARIGTDSGWAAVLVRRTHICALRDAGAATGSLYCWGESDNGAVGNGAVWRDEPTPVDP